MGWEILLLLVPVKSIGYSQKCIATRPKTRLMFIKSSEIRGFQVALSVLDHVFIISSFLKIKLIKPITMSEIKHVFNLKQVDAGRLNHYQQIFN